MSDNYTEEDIITLSEVEAIRQNPGMFIGSTDNPNHLLYEALDNALDEANNGLITKQEAINAVLKSKISDKIDNSIMDKIKRII